MTESEITHRLYDSSFNKAEIPEYSGDKSFINHGQVSLKRLKDKLFKYGFNTDVLLQSHEHPEPTAELCIGVPRNFPMFREKEQLSKWGNDIVLRIHLGIFKQGSDLVSVPHIEPDPKFCPLEHMMMFMRNDAEYDEVACVLFQAFLGDDEAWNIVHLRNVFDGVM
jgi:hypothetical protein